MSFGAKFLDDFLRLESVVLSHQKSCHEVRRFPLFAISVKLSLLKPILLEHKEHLKQKLTQIRLISQKTASQNIQADWGG